MSLLIPWLPLALLSCERTVRAPHVHPDSGGATAVDTAGDTDPGQTGERDTGDTGEPCALYYQDVAADWGLSSTVDGGGMPLSGSAVGLLDVDGDGLDDALIAPREGGLRLHRNAGGGLEAAQVLLEEAVSGLAAGDVDGDGDLDLFAGGDDWKALLENRGGSFVDASARSGLDDVALFGEILTASFGDADGDGDMDLYIVPRVPGDNPTEDRLHKLLINDGAGRFADASRWLPEDARGGLTWAALWFDADLDGDQDLYLANDLHEDRGQSRLFRSDGQDGDELALTDVTEDCGCGASVYAMGGMVADYDEDGLLDFYLTSTGPSGLYRNLGGLDFVDVAEVEGARVWETVGAMSMGSTWVDFDADGDEDLFVVSGRQAGTRSELDLQSTEQRDALLRRGEAGFEDVAASYGLDDPGDGRSVAAGRLDEDGAPDLLVGVLETESHLYLARCAPAEALWVELEGARSNRLGVGARVVAQVGDRQLTRLVTTDSGYGGVRHPRAHFGLGSGAVEALTVYWPSGAVQQVPEAAGASGRLVVTEP